MDSLQRGLSLISRKDRGPNKNHNRTLWLLDPSNTSNPANSYTVEPVVRDWSKSTGGGGGGGEEEVWVVE